MVAKQLIPFFKYKVFSLKNGLYICCRYWPRSYLHFSICLSLHTFIFWFFDFSDKVVGIAGPHRLGFCFSWVQIWPCTDQWQYRLKYWTAANSLLLAVNYASVSIFRNVVLRVFSPPQLIGRESHSLTAEKQKIVNCPLEFLPLEIERHSICMQTMQIFTAFLFACECLSSGKIHQEGMTKKKAKRKLGQSVPYNEVFVHRGQNISPCCFASKGFC